MAQIASVLGGLIATLIGLWAIITPRITVSEDELGEESGWVYGWRAVVIGCLALLGACVFFASAAGLIHLSWV
jgi:membrane protein YqaA with SNARE-associated domain